MPASGPFNPHLCKPCPPSCDNPFDRVVVSYLIRAGTTVLWDLVPEFTDPLPYEFQLQVGTTSNNDADDWVDVGGAVTNQYFAVDDAQRVHGNVNWTYYRVLLTTSSGQYVSDPVNLMGTLPWRDWRLARDIVRRQRLENRLAAQNGYLLKRRISGEVCPVCLDKQTQEVLLPDCTVCYGTGYKCGYYFPMACVWAKLSPRSRRIELDAGAGRGTVNDIVVQAENMLMCELLNEDDVWINAVTDDRYYIHRITHTAEIRGVPLFADVEMRPISYTSVIYSIEIPQQLIALDSMLS